MQTTPYLVSLVLVASALGTPARAADIGVSVNISEPGFYGRIDIGRVPAPVLLYPQPLIIEQRPVTLVREPIYLRVPPGHAKNWGKYCGRYQACGQPVYFVQDDWYRNVYEPRYYGDSKHHGDDRDNGKHNKGHGKH